MQTFRLISVGLVVVTLAALSGCSSGFNRQALDAELRTGSQSENYQIVGDTSSETVSAEAIQRARELKPQLKFPFRLAVALETPSGQGNFRWSVKDKEIISSWGETLRKRGVVSDLFVMTELAGKNSSRVAIRLAAAKHGADAVLIIKAASQLDQYTNPSALLYLSIVGLWLVPGSHIDALVMIRGSVFDVGNEYLYASVESEGEGSTFGPLVYIKDECAIDKAKNKALSDFGKGLTERLTGLK